MALIIKCLGYFTSILLLLCGFARCSVLDQDPFSFPGHLLPFGEGRDKILVETIDTDFPSPQDFFLKYVDGSKPLLIKGAAKSAPAFKLWNDAYFTEHPDAKTAMVYTEPELKENRTKEGKTMSLYDFINVYHDKGIYLVDDVPQHLKKDVPMPPPLRCDETENMLFMTLMWFSAGGTKSVLHQDSVDNINCLFRGSKRLLLFNTEKYQWKLPIDIMHKKYSNVDIDRVDYTKYPSLREIDEVFVADMEEGDCLYIPFMWTHQVNSVRNEDLKQNVAVNVWFQHVLGHKPCQSGEVPPRVFIDEFHARERAESILEQETPDFAGLLGALLDSVFKEEDSTIKYKKFRSSLYNTASVPVFRNKKLMKEKNFRNFTRQMFKLLDTSNDSRLSRDDVLKMEFIDNRIRDAGLLFNEMLEMANALAEWRTPEEAEFYFQPEEEEEEGDYDEGETQPEQQQQQQTSDNGEEPREESNANESVTKETNDDVTQKEEL